jgi:hypothetical protein
MNGGNSIADALNKQQEISLNSKGPTSIAMRLKKNRDALISGNSIQNSNSKQQDEKLYSAANPFTGMSNITQNYGQ